MLQGIFSKIKNKMVITSNSNNTNSNNNNNKFTSSTAAADNSNAKANDKKAALNPFKSSGNSVIEAMKRKFQRVNQEIVKQNVLLQENLARIRQDQHATLQENVRMKGRIVALESKLKEAESVVSETKKSIADRIEILEAIGEHLIQVTKFLRILSQDEENQHEEQTSKAEADANEIFNENKIVKSTRRLTTSSGTPMQSIAEEELLELTDHISDVSLDHPKPLKRTLKSTVNFKRNK